MVFFGTYIQLATRAHLKGTSVGQVRNIDEGKSARGPETPLKNVLIRGDWAKYSKRLEWQQLSGDSCIAINYFHYFINIDEGNLPKNGIYNSFVPPSPLEIFCLN